MVADFPKNLYMLRQERGISQRTAASSLKVSQALLSHYENGAREPGLDFLLRAAAFYGVSTDYLLGRTTYRGADPCALPQDRDSQDRKDEFLTAGHGRALGDAIRLLFEILDDKQNAKATEQAAEYIGLSVYRMFRMLCEVPERDAGGSPPDFALPALCDIESRRLELALRCRLLSENRLKIHPESIPEPMRRTAESLLSLYDSALRARGGNLGDI